MRKFFTSVLAFFASLLSGGMVAQILAVATNAGQEFIIVFFAVVLVAMIVGVPFFVAKFFANAKKAIDRVGIGLSALLFVSLLGLIVVAVVDAPAGGINKGDLSVIAGLILPSIVIVAVQWLLVRAMLPKPAMTFGRTETAP